MRALSNRSIHFVFLKKLRRVPKKFVLFFSTLILTIALIFFLARGEMFQLYHIEVNINPSPWSKKVVESIESEIINKVENFKGQATWRVDLNEVVKVIKEEPRVRHVRILRKLPNRMGLRVDLHEPLALLMGLNGDLLPVPKDARLLPAMGEPPDLPILRGLNFHKDRGLREQALRMLEDISVASLSGLSEFFRGSF